MAAASDRSRPWLRRLEACRPARLRALLCAGVGLFLLGLISHAHHAGSGDAVHYMMIARSLAFDRDLDLANDYSDPGNVIMNGRLTPGRHALPGRGGVLRPIHDVGLPLLAAPAFAVAYVAADRLTERLPAEWLRRARLDRWIMLRQLVGLGMIALTCLLATRLFDTCHALGGGKALSFLWALLWAVSPPILSHGQVFLTEVPSALVALHLFRARLEAETWTLGRCLRAGLLTGLLPLLHARNAGLALALLALSAHDLFPDRRRLAALGLGAGLLCAVRTGLNLYFWGSLLTTPHARLGAWSGWIAQAEEAAGGLGGLLFDQRHGLLVCAPLYLLAPAGWLLLRRRAPAAARDAALLVTAYLLPVVLPLTNVHGWRGGWSPAARFLVPVAPLLALGVPLALAAIHGRRASLAGTVLAVIGLQGLLDALFWSRPKLLWSEGAGPAPLLTALGGEAWAAALPRWGPPAPRDLLISAALAAAGALLTAWLVRRPGHQR